LKNQWELEWIHYQRAPPFADAIMEAVEARIELACCITEGVPVLHMSR
jgi:succinyl-CoA synthetase alpha subunit